MATMAVLGCNNPSNNDVSNGNFDGGGGLGDGNTQIQLTNGNPSELTTWTGETANISFNANSTGTYYYIIRRSTYSAPAVTAILNQTTSSSNTAMGTGSITQVVNTIQVSGLSDNTEYTAYIVAKNSSTTSELLTLSGVTTTAKIKSWTVIDRPAIFDGMIKKVIFAEGKFLAITNNKLFISTDGITWDSRNLPASGSMNYVTGIAYGNGVLVISLYDYYAHEKSKPYNTAIFSTDTGNTWNDAITTPFSDNFQNPPSLLKFAGSRFIMYNWHRKGLYNDDPATAYFSYSIDGSTWNSSSKDGTVGDFIVGDVVDVACGNGYYVATRYSGVIISTDGFASANWTPLNVSWSSDAGMTCIAFNAEKNLFIAADGSRISTSTNGSSWSNSITVNNSFTLSHAESISSANGVVVIGTDGWKEIWYSSSLEKWSRFAIEGFLVDFAQDTSLVAYGNGRFVVLTSLNEIAYTN
jgi:hypothetical protein